MDRDGGASPSEIGLTANPAERPIESPAPSSLAGTSGWLALIGALLIHVGILAFLVFERELTPAIAPTAREIPVEIVVETPQPKPPDGAEPTPEPTPAARPIDLAPATDAPRAANDEKIERQAPDEATKAPGPPTPTTAPSLSPAPAEAAGPTRQSEPDAAQDSAEPVLDKAVDAQTRALEADRRAPEERPASAEPNAQPDRLPTFIGEPFPSWSKGAEFAASEYLPEVELGSAAGPTAVSGGKAKSTYLSVLYGMIMSHVRMPPAASHAKFVGKIAFTVDGTGNLVERSVARPSGSRDLDSAALAAVAEAAPFPPPPQGLPARLTFSYDAR